MHKHSFFFVPKLIFLKVYSSCTLEYLLAIFFPIGFSVQTSKLIGRDLSGELSQLRSDWQTLSEQEAVKGVAVERFQIHLVLIIPELIQSFCTDYHQMSETQREKKHIKNQ